MESWCVWLFLGPFERCSHTTERSNGLLSPRAVITTESMQFGSFPFVSEHTGTPVSPLPRSTTEASRCDTATQANCSWACKECTASATRCCGVSVASARTRIVQWPLPEFYSAALASSLLDHQHKGASTPWMFVWNVHRHGTTSRRVCRELDSRCFMANISKCVK